MPSHHLNGTENNILKLISDHVKKAFYLFFWYSDDYDPYGEVQEISSRLCKVYQ